MVHVLWFIPVFFAGWFTCYIQMTYGVDQGE
jgi:hypothetical protein